MNFAVDLWGNYDVVLDNFMQNRKGLREFLQLIRDLHDVEDNYTKSLQKVLDRKFEITTHPGLANAIQVLRKDYSNQINYHLDWANSIREEIALPSA